MAETVSILDRLNTLAKKTPVNNRSIFTKDVVNHWDSSNRVLYSQFQALESDEEREKWLKRFFIELFQILLQENTPERNNFPIVAIATFINDISKLTPTASKIPTKSLMGKMFIAASLVVPSLTIDRSDDLLTLTKAIPNIHEEVFKFSWISTKLTIKPQTTLLRHLMKKSKYELKKFNLFFENSVGYSQLSILFFTAYSDQDRLQKLEFYLEQMYSIIGQYSLDSMRCLDLFLLISNEYVTEHYHFMLKFLQLSDYWPLEGRLENIIASNLIAFFLVEGEKKYKKGAENDQKSSTYLDMCCILIKNGFINFNTLWNNLGPTIEELETSLDDFEKHLEEESMKGIENPLAMAAALSMKDDDYDPRHDPEQTKTESEEQKKSEVQKESKQNTKAEENILKVINSGKIKLLKRVLVHGYLQPIIPILQRYPRIIHIDDELPRLVSRILSQMILPLYNKTKFGNLSSSPLSNSSRVTRIDNELLSTKPRLIDELRTHDPFQEFEFNTVFTFYYPEWKDGISDVETIEDLIKRSHELFTLVGPSLAKDPQFIAKICRIGIFDINEDGSSTEVIAKWIDYARKFLFPTIPVLGINPIAATEIYELMKYFPFERRYFMYNEMITKLSQDSLIIKVGFNKAERDAKNILKALSTDTVDKEARNLSKLISTNPLATLVHTVKQIENYDKVSELVVITTKFFNDFAYDVLQYVLLLRLTHPRNAVQEDGVNQAMWVQRLSVFIAGLAKRCPKMDLTNIVTYLVKTLHAGNVIAVSILKELIVTVGGVRDFNEVNKKQLIMLNSGNQVKRGGRKLIFDFRDDNVELASNLLSLFVAQDSISEIILLLYNLNLEVNTGTSHYKILSSRCDEMNTLLWSFIELIKFCLTNEDFEKNILPFDVFINEFHMSSAWVFHIWRDYFDSQYRKLEESPEKERDTKINIQHMDKVLNGTQYTGVNFEQLSKDLFITFWRLSLYDIHFDKGLYDENKVSLENEISPTLSSRKRHTLKNQIKETFVDRISHQRTFNKTIQMLSDKSKIWYENFDNSEIIAFLQACIIPRALFTPSDALYASYFLLQVFPLDQLMKIYEILFGSRILSNLLFSCTSFEASNLGMFFANIFESMEQTRQTQDLPSEYRIKIYEWYSSLTEQLCELLGEKNYMSIRNGIEFMKQTSAIFPIVDSHVTVVIGSLEKNLVDEEREDIKLASK